MRVILLFFLMSTASWTFASTMECYNGVIDSAETDPPDQQEVRQRCGEPDQENNGGTQWVYNQSEFTYILSFDEDGLLYDIQSSEAE